MAERCGMQGSLEHRLYFQPILNHYIKILPLPLIPRDASSKRISSHREVRHGVEWIKYQFTGGSLQWSPMDLNFQSEIKFKIFKRAGKRPLFIRVGILWFQRSTCLIWLLTDFAGNILYFALYRNLHYFSHIFYIIFTVKCLWLGSKPPTNGLYIYLAPESCGNIWFTTKQYKDVCSFIHSVDLFRGVFKIYRISTLY